MVLSVRVTIAGASYVNESFAPFGARRNPATWSGAPTTGDQTLFNGVTRIGYTGQTMLGNLGLIHMNGRVQDATLGRFLSADPYVTSPSDPRSFNRYTYVVNNPLSYVDPSGFRVCDDVQDGQMCAPNADGTCPSGTSPVRENGRVIYCIHADVTVTPTPGGPSSPSSPGGVYWWDFRDRNGEPASQTGRGATQRSCTNYFQVGTGLLAMGLGAAQAVGGFVEGLIGLAGAPESFGATLLIGAKGVADVGLGAVAARDGLSLVQTGFDGVQRGSTLGDIGESVAGPNGRVVGDMANVGLGVKDLANAANKGSSNGIGVNLINNAFSAIAPDSMKPCQ